MSIYSIYIIYIRPYTTLLGHHPRATSDVGLRTPPGGTTFRWNYKHQFSTPPSTYTIIQRTVIIPFSTIHTIQ